MNQSRFLAKVLGLYLIIVALAYLVNMSVYTGIITNLLNNNALMIITAFMTLIIGLLLVVAHNVWEFSWRVIITIVGWLTLIKAVCLLFFPDYMNHMNLQILQNTSVISISLFIDLILGLILLFFGFKKN